MSFEFTVELKDSLNRLSTGPTSTGTAIAVPSTMGILPRSGTTHSAGTNKQSLTVTLDWSGAAGFAPGKYFIAWSLRLSNGSTISNSSSTLEVLGSDKIPVITSMDPTPFCNYPPTPTGVFCVLKGKNLNWPGTEIKVGGVALSIRALSPESITYTIGNSREIATSPLVVSNPSGSATSISTIKMPISISSFSPLAGAPGTVINLKGINFSDAVADVTFGGVSTGAGNFKILSPTEMTAAVPNGAVEGYIKTVITNPLTRTAVSTSIFIATPYISSFTPSSARAGDTVVITGRNLKSIDSVMIGDTSQVITTKSPKSLSFVIAPYTDVGKNTITVKNIAGNATSSGNILILVKPEGQKLASVGGSTCAVTNARGVKCWGSNEYGQLGDGTTQPRLTAVNVTGLNSGVVSVAGYDYYSTGSYYSMCALTDAGAVKCWGSNKFGQLGNGSTIDSPSPVQVIGAERDVRKLVIGDSICALFAQGNVKCWGGKKFTISGINTPSDISGVTKAIQLVAGTNHWCALQKTGGLVQCWGINGWSQISGSPKAEYTTSPVQISELSEVTDIFAKFNTSCAQTLSGQFKCWGFNLFKKILTEMPNSYIAPTVISEVTSKVIDFSVTAKTQITSSQLAYSSCLLLGNGQIRCWGQNNLGELGDGGGGTTSNSNIDYGYYGSNVLVANLPPNPKSMVTQVGYSRFCALYEDAKAYCWGGLAQANTPGASQNLASILPGYEEGILEVTLPGPQLSAYYNTCALLKNQSKKCQGAIGMGWLGNGKAVFYPTPTTPPLNNSAFSDQSVTSDSEGTQLRAYLNTDGSLRCFSASLGQVNFQAPRGCYPVSSSQNYFVPVPKSTQVTGDGRFICALTNDGSVYCIGQSSAGETGSVTPIYVTDPVQVAGVGTGNKLLVSGSGYSCVLTSQNGVKCWGSNRYGTLGVGHTNTISGTVDVSGLTAGVKSITSGKNHACALLEANGEVKCWGAVENTLNSEFLSPKTLSNLESGVLAISANPIGNNTCAIKSGGQVYCWGNNRYGQLGSSTFEPFQNTPTPIVGLPAPATQLAMGGQTVCVLLNNGQVACWGSNKYGELGNSQDATFMSTSTNNPYPVYIRPYPKNIESLGNVKSITAWHAGAAGSTFCALREDGSNQCWGDFLSPQNDFGISKGYEVIPTTVLNF